MTAPTYQGEPDNITIPASVNIASSTNATPIIIQTSAPHGILDATRVTVKGHQVNTAANGIWQVGFVDSTHMKLLTSVGNGVGGATGTVQGINFGAVTLVDGSVPPTAAAINTPPEFLTDASTLMLQNTGSYKFVDSRIEGNTDDTNSVWDTFTITADSTWTGDSLSSLFVDTTLKFNAGDLVDIDLDIISFFEQASGSATQASCDIALFYSFATPGAVFPAATRAPYSSRLFTSVVPSTSLFIISTRHLSTRLTVPAGNSSNIKLILQAKSQAHAAIQGGVVTLVGDYFLRINQYRATVGGIPQ